MHYHDDPTIEGWLIPLEQPYAQYNAAYPDAPTAWSSPLSNDFGLTSIDSSHLTVIYGSRCLDDPVQVDGCESLDVQFSLHDTYDGTYALSTTTPELNGCADSSRMQRVRRLSPDQSLVRGAAQVRSLGAASGHSAAHLPHLDVEAVVPGARHPVQQQACVPARDDAAPAVVRHPPRLDGVGWRRRQLARGRRREHRLRRAGVRCVGGWAMGCMPRVTYWRDPGTSRVVQG